MLESLGVVTDAKRGVIAIPAARFAEVVRRATEAELLASPAIAGW